MDRKAVHFCYVVKLSYLYFTDGVITIRMGPASGIEMGLSAPAMNHRAGEGYFSSVPAYDRVKTEAFSENLS